MFHRARSLLLPLIILSATPMFACGGPGAQSPGSGTTAERVFELAAPSVVAIMNDDRQDRIQEMMDAQRSLGDELHAPKKVIDVSVRKEPMPHGTGFMLEDGTIATAAHVVTRPDRLKITTRSGQTVDAELVRIDEIRDVAILRPKTPLKDVPPLPLGTANPVVGQKVWPIGHTGRGSWKLSWGMSEGIASGVVDMYESKLLLFDAAVYPGFSGGPVVTMEADGRPHVVGVNHAILFAGWSGNNPIFSAAALDELRATVAGTPHPLEKILADYAKTQRTRQYADIFITDVLAVGRDPAGNQIASFYNTQKQIRFDEEGHARVPAVVMFFGLPKDSTQEVTFEIRDPGDHPVVSEATTVKVGPHERVTFASAELRFVAKDHGKYAVVAKLGAKELGRSFVVLARAGDDEQLTEDSDTDSTDDGDPDVDVVVASGGRADPLSISGIRAAWLERSFPRRVSDYTWFARGTRGWSGQFVRVSGYAVDEQGHVIGHSEGCTFNELRPEKPWSCIGSGGMMPTPLAQREGPYDIVFAINERPVAWWPMEAIIHQDHFPGSEIERWGKDLKRVIVKRQETLH